MKLFLAGYIVNGYRLVDCTLCSGDFISLHLFRYNCDIVWKVLGAG